MQCFVVDTTKAPFFRSLIRALKYTDVVLVFENYWDDFIPTLKAFIAIVLFNLIS